MISQTSSLSENFDRDFESLDYSASSDGNDSFDFVDALNPDNSYNLFSEDLEVIEIDSTNTSFEQ
jgi:hypothetical protein